MRKILKLKIQLSQNLKLVTTYSPYQNDALNEHIITIEMLLNTIWGYIMCLCINLSAEFTHKKKDWKDKI